MNESERVERDKEIIDKIIQKLPASYSYYIKHNKAEKLFFVGHGKKRTTNTEDYSVLQFVSRERTR